MFVLIASEFRPSWAPGHEDIARQLEIAFRDHGHEVESIQVPFDRNPNELWSQLFAFRMTNVSDVADLLVATSAPCHLLRHRRKVLWLTEHYPWLDDESPALHALMTADRQACAEARAAFTVSEPLRARISRSGDRDVQLLPPPQGSWDRVVAALTEAGRDPAGP